MMDRCIRELFEKLHNNPECSGKEHKTNELIKDFMNRNTSMTYHELPGGFYYEHRGNDSPGSIVLRADYDAVTVDEGKALHLCGHDGHSASLCQCALRIEKEGVNNNVKLLFQSSEENGQGAKNCLEALDEDDIIYGHHNLPGFPFGKVFTSMNTFACTSCGLILELKGKSSHAAYPELGVSPSLAVSDILQLCERYKTLDQMITVIGIRMGEETFGVMAHEAKIYLTLRSKTDEKLLLLKKEIIDHIDNGKGNLEFTYHEVDYFPATVNHPEQAGTVLKKLNGELLKDPMRWSEDFAYYLKDHKGAFFGIGAGIDYPGLHTSEYCYPVELIDITAECFYNLVK
jgi:amidohydrolase